MKINAMYLLFPTIFIWNCLYAQNDANINKNQVQSDEMFPSSPTAKRYVDFDGKGLVIKGKRMFLVSGSIHYPRVPEAYWHGRLLKLKRAGFNTVETYVFWNFHENKEGVYDFTSERHNLGAFLDEAKKVGLYAIVRVGPYICGEWENGGFPTWLMQKKGMELRTKDNQAYLVEVSKWFNKMLPIISERQIQKGGNVILVQLENEHPAEHWKYWGTNMYGKYYEVLLDLARKNGLEIPLFFSGMHHAFDPIKEPILPQQRTCPWMCMELWTTWFNNYEVNPDLGVKAERASWRVASEGGAGFNLYMAHGGTTFGYYNFNNDSHFGDKAEKGGSSYDYGTLIGQTGDTRNLYRHFKRLGYFAESFAPLLANSINSSDKFKDWIKGIHVTARTAPEGTVLFLDNPGNDTTFTLPSGKKMQMGEKEIVPLIKEYTVAPGLVIKNAETRILGIASYDKIITIICYGAAGDTGGLELATAANSGEQKKLSFSFTKGEEKEQVFTLGKQKIRILTMDKDAAGKTWIINKSDKQWVVSGADYVGNFGVKPDGALFADIENPWLAKMPATLRVYASDKKVLLASNSKTANPQVIHLNSWKKFQDPVSTSTDRLGGASSLIPEIGVDGCESPYAWYRTTINNTQNVNNIRFQFIGDRAKFYIDGKLSARYDFRKDTSLFIPINIESGKHDLAVFVAYSGRNKLAGYMGQALPLKFSKGLVGPVIFNQKDTANLQWQMKGVDYSSNLKEDNTLNTQSVPAFYAANFNLQSTPLSNEVYWLKTTGLSSGSVWMNGHNIGKYPELIKNCPGIYLPSAWMKPGKNIIVVYDEEGSQPDSDVKVVFGTQDTRKQIRFEERIK